MATWNPQTRNTRDDLENLQRTVFTVTGDVKLVNERNVPKWIKFSTLRSTLRHNVLVLFEVSVDEV